jgi:hemerythrin
MITWDKQYETGFETIDNQHKELVRIISRLSDLLTDAVDGDDIYDDMVAIIDDLTAYTIYHFKYEEDLFNQFNYESKEAHMAEHSKLINDIHELDLRQAEESPVVFGKKILKFLISWLFKHISGTDFLYKDFMAQNGVK